VFLDVVESVSVLVSAKGQVLRSEINGAIKMRVFLSGMPELRLGLNDKVQFEAAGKSKSSCTRKCLDCTGVCLTLSVSCCRFSSIVFYAHCTLVLSQSFIIVHFFLFLGTGKGKTVELEDVKFHQCVRLARFDADRTISFIPPDGEFDLMTYRLTSNVRS
jgi:AP-1 complex subunit mu